VSDALSDVSGCESDERTSAPCLSPQLVGLLTCIAVFLALSLMIFYNGSKTVLRHVFDFVPRRPGLAWGGSLCVVTAASIVMLLPIWPPLCIGNGLIFGLWQGAAVNIAAIVSAAVICILLGRGLLRDTTRSYIMDGGCPRVRRMMLVVEDHENSFLFLVLFRFLFIPMFIRNYGVATLNVSLWMLFMSVLPHSIWISVLFASMGSTLQGTVELLRQGHELSLSNLSWQQSLIVAVALAMTAVITACAHRWYAEEFAKEEEAPLRGAAAMPAASSSLAAAAAPP